MASIRSMRRHGLCVSLSLDCAVCLQYLTALYQKQTKCIMLPRCKNANIKCKLCYVENTCIIFTTMSTETQNNIDIVVLFSIHIHQHCEYISKQRQPFLVCEYPDIYQFSIKSQIYSQFTLIYRLKHNGLSYNSYTYKNWTFGWTILQSYIKVKLKCQATVKAFISQSTWLLKQYKYQSHVWTPCVCVDNPLQMGAPSMSEKTPQSTPSWYAWRDF